jgi:hypothetical protein
MRTVDAGQRMAGRTLKILLFVKIQVIAVNNVPIWITNRGSIIFENSKK